MQLFWNQKYPFRRKKKVVNELSEESKKRGKGMVSLSILASLY